LHTTSKSHTQGKSTLSQPHFTDQIRNHQDSHIDQITYFNKIAIHKFLYLSIIIIKIIINLFTHLSNQEAYQIQHRNLSFSFKSWPRPEPLRFTS